MKRTFVALCSLFACANISNAACIERIQDSYLDPGIKDFITRAGGESALAGAYQGHGHRIEFHIKEDRILGRVDRSALSPIRICSTQTPGELKVETLNPDGTVSAKSFIRVKGSGRIGVKGRGTLGGFVTFARTESFPIPRTQLALATVRGTRAPASR